MKWNSHRFSPRLWFCSIAYWARRCASPFLGYLWIIAGQCHLYGVMLPLLQSGFMLWDISLLHRFLLFCFWILIAPIVLHYRSSFTIHSQFSLWISDQTIILTSLSSLSITPNPTSTPDLLFPMNNLPDSDPDFSFLFKALVQNSPPLSRITCHSTYLHRCIQTRGTPFCIFIYANTLLRDHLCLEATTPTFRSDNEAIRYLPSYSIRWPTYLPPLRHSF